MITAKYILDYKSIVPKTRKNEELPSILKKKNFFFFKY